MRGLWSRLEGSGHSCYWEGGCVVGWQVGAACGGHGAPACKHFRQRSPRSSLARARVEFRSKQRQHQVCSCSDTLSWEELSPDFFLAAWGAKPRGRVQPTIGHIYTSTYNRPILSLPRPSRFIGIYHTLIFVPLSSSPALHSSPNIHPPFFHSLSRCGH